MHVYDIYLGTERIEPTNSKVQYQQRSVQTCVDDQSGLIIVCLKGNSFHAVTINQTHTTRPGNFLTVLIMTLKP